MMISYRLEKQLKIIYRELISITQQAHHTCRESRKSRDNLLSYIALQKYNPDELSYLLQEAGLASLNNAQEHILFTIGKVLDHLGMDESVAAPISACSISESKAILQTRADRVLGKSPVHRKTRIMVTLDAKMIQDKALMEKLLEKGMDIARINCAHGNPKIWEELILLLRTSEEKLRANGKWNGSRCRIYMDLAGPKIRIGTIEREEKPIFIKVPADLYGKEIGPVDGYMDTKADRTVAHTDSFRIAIDKGSPIDLLETGDKLKFQDLNNQKRTLRVIERISETCLKVELDYSALLSGSIVINHDKGAFPVRSLPQEPVDIKLSKGNHLRLYLDEKRQGHAATKCGPAGVPVTLRKALLNVRPKDRVFIDDGKISGVVHQVEKEYIDVRIIFPEDKTAKVKEGKGVNLPDSLTSLNVPALTDKDLSDLPFIVRHADMIGISFVHSPKDLKLLSSQLNQLSASHLPVIAKIETKDAIHQLGRILLEGLSLKRFAVMIARGDLAMEVGYGHLYTAQEEISNLCSAAHIPVIWATGVLENATKKGVPARSEITDAAVGGKKEAIMLNKGKYILESLHLLNQILTNESTSIRTRKSCNHLYSQLGIFNSKW